MLSVDGLTLVELHFGLSERLRFNMVQTSQVKDGPEIHCGQLEPSLQHNLQVNTLLWTEGCVGRCGPAQLFIPETMGRQDCVTIFKLNNSF